MVYTKSFLSYKIYTHSLFLCFYTFSACIFVSHSALFEYFQTLPGRYCSRKPPKGWKTPIFEHFPNTTRLHKPPRSVAHPLTSNTFCSVVPLLTCSSSHILHFLGTFEHFLTLLTPKSTGDIQKLEESSHC